MPNTNAFVQRLISPSGKSKAAQLRTFVLQPLDAANLALIAQEDAKGSFQKACVSMADAMGGIGRGLLSWAYVKLYYATFYLARARLLAVKKECHIYIERTPYALDCIKGSTLIKGAGTSHEFAFSRFANRFTGITSISQNIDSVQPFNWIRKLREEIQYSSANFSDGGDCDFLPLFKRKHAPQIIREYLGRDQLLYAFDPEHAAVAFPLLFFCETAKELAAPRVALLTKLQLNFIVERLRVGSDSIGQLVALVRSLAEA